MNKHFIALCQCQKVVCSEKGRKAFFRFSGFVSGIKISLLEIHLSETDNIETGKDYLMALELIRLLDENIICRIMKYRML